MPDSSDAAHDSNLEQNIAINVIFADKIQQDVAMRVLLEFLGAWRTNVEAADKRNRVTITEGGHLCE